jgi:hypothetical protein
MLLHSGLSKTFTSTSLGLSPFMLANSQSCSSCLIVVLKQQVKACCGSQTPKADTAASTALTASAIGLHEGDSRKARKEADSAAVRRVTPLGSRYKDAWLAGSIHRKAQTAC